MCVGCMVAHVCQENKNHSNFISPSFDLESHNFDFWLLNLNSDLQSHNWVNFDLVNSNYDFCHNIDLKIIWYLPNVSLNVLKLINNVIKS